MFSKVLGVFLIFTSGFVLVYASHICSCAASSNKASITIQYNNIHRSHSSTMFFFQILKISLSINEYKNVCKLLLVRLRRFNVQCHWNISQKTFRGRTRSTSQTFTFLLCALLPLFTSISPSTVVTQHKPWNFWEPQVMRDLKKIY